MTNVTYKEWITIARLDLRDSESNFERREHSRSLYFLHELSEKTFKALTLRTGFSSENPDQVIEDALKIKLNVPKDYGHFFRDEFIDQLEALFESQLVRESAEMFGVKEIQKRLSIARSTKAVDNPTETEIIKAIELSKEELSKRDQVKDVSKYLREEDVETLMNKVNVAFGSKGGIPEISVIFARLQNTAALFSAFGPLLFLSVFLDPYYWAKYPNRLDPSVIVSHYEEIKGVLETCVNIAEG